MMTIDKTPASAAPETRTLLPTWLAYPAAGLSFVAAAYLLTSIPAFLALYADLGVEVPGLVKLQLSYPRLLPLGMIALGLLVLLGTRGRIAVGPNARAVRGLSGAGSVGLVLFSILMVLMNAMTVRTLQQMAGEEDTRDERRVEQKLAWAKNLPPASPVALARRVSLAGTGEPLREAVASLAKQAGIKLRLSPSVEALKSTTTLKQVEWRKALDALVRARGLRVYEVAEDDLILVEANTRRPVHVQSIEFKSTPLREALRAVRTDGSSALVTCDPSLAKRPVTFQFVEAPAPEILAVLAVLADCRVGSSGGARNIRLVPHRK